MTEQLRAKVNESLSVVKSPKPLTPKGVARLIRRGIASVYDADRPRRHRYVVQDRRDVLTELAVVFLDMAMARQADHENPARLDIVADQDAEWLDAVAAALE